MRSRLAFLILALLAVAAAGVMAAAGATRARNVHLRGTAYEFNNVHTVLAGATIRVVEFPRLKAVVQPDGRYDLTVPDRTRVTPYIILRGYHTIYLQTFTTNGEDLANVNFQTPTEAVYNGLVALLSVPVDAQGNPRQCAIVSTFSTRNVRDLSYAKFIAYGAHGVAGATASGRPALPKPVYFNKSVLPDPAQTSSSQDGGVVWTNVPAGVYTVTAHDPPTRFASFVATCRPGRVINANPPWGLHQLGLADPTRISSAWSVTGARTSAHLLRLGALPRGSTVQVRCSGQSCPFGSRTFHPSGSRLDLRGSLGPFTLRAGNQLAVMVSAHTFNSAVWHWAILKGRAPKRTTLCIPLGNTKPRPRCAASHA